MKERFLRFMGKLIGRPYRHQGGRGQFASQRYTSRRRR